MSSLVTSYLTIVTLFLCGRSHAQDRLPWNGDIFARLVSDINDILDVLDVNNTLRFSDKCNSALREFTSAFTAEQHWAWKMADAWGYQPSGTFLHDGMWEGSYEGCIRTPSRPPYITGHHCVVRWTGAMNHDGLGVCVPKNCSMNDVKVLLVTGSQNNKLPLPYNFTPNIGSLQGHCSVPVEEKKFDGSAVAAIIVLSLLALIVFTSTTYDVITTYCRPAASSCYTNDSSKVNEDKKEPEDKMAFENGAKPELDTAHATKENDNVENIQLEPKEEGNEKSGNIDAERKYQKQKTESLCSEFLVSFSLCRHIPWILSFEQGKGSIPCLHGIRSLTFAWIVLGHSWNLGITLTSLNTVSNGVFNKEQTVWKQIIESIHFAVDGFFILSGMLTTISLLKKFEKGQFTCKAVPYYIFHRWWRLTPVYMMIVMFYGCLFPYLGSGPFYDPHLRDVEGCKTGWWWNILYINNFWLGRSHDCLSWSWYLANDFQFYLVSPLFVLALVKKPKLGIGIIIGFIVSCIVIRWVLFGILWPCEFVIFFTQIYTPPYTRSSTYFLGMLTGYFLFKKHFLPIRIHKALLCFLWILMTGLILLITFLPYTNQDKSWNNNVTVFLASIGRTIFGAGVCWIIIACISNNGGIINTILSWNGWLPISRVSYVGYLVHPIIILFTYYSSPVQLYLTRWVMLYYFIGHFTLTCVVSMLVSACLEIPFRKLESLMIKALQNKCELSKML